MPHLLLGVLLVAVCTTASVLLTLSAGDRREVLALLHAVPLGHVLSAGDLRTVSVAADDDVTLVPADDSGSILGRPVAAGLPAGALLSPEMVGGDPPAPGRAISALALMAGQFPPELSPGMHVDVVAVPDSAAPGIVQPAPSGPWAAVVLGIGPAEDGQLTVVSLDLDAGDATRVAAAGAGRVSLVVVAPR